MEQIPQEQILMECRNTKLKKSAHRDSNSRFTSMLKILGRLINLNGKLIVWQSFLLFITGHSLVDWKGKSHDIHSLNYYYRIAG